MSKHRITPAQRARAALAWIRTNAGILLALPALGCGPVLAALFDVWNLGLVVTALGGIALVDALHTRRTRELGDLVRLAERETRFAQRAARHATEDLADANHRARRAQQECDALRQAMRELVGPDVLLRSAAAQPPTRLADTGTGVHR